MNSMVFFYKKLINYKNEIREKLITRMKHLLQWTLVLLDVLVEPSSFLCQVVLICDF